MPRTASSLNDPQLGAPNSFGGFALPVSNSTYTPNQFFDVCLPYASRGSVRIVGFLIRKTLGWCDEDGNPTESRFSLSYADFERSGGVGHSSIRSALDEATAPVRAAGFDGSAFYIRAFCSVGRVRTAMGRR